MGEKANPSDAPDELAQRAEALERRLAEAEAQRERHAKALEALMAGAESILGNTDFGEAARAIFDFCCDMTGATSGYVALLSEDGRENELLFLESGGLSCTVDPELPMPIRGLRAEAYRRRQPVYHNDFMDSRWAELMPQGHVVLRNVMFAPLVVDGDAAGIIGLANKPTDFDAADAAIAGGFGRLAAIALQKSKDIEARNRAEAELERMATTDPLTGVLNRRAFFDAAQDEVDRCRRYGRPLACMMLDIDHFKAINDEHGHPFGDTVLRELAGQARTTLRKHDVLGRLGGEEFAALLPETDAEQAVRVGQRLLDDVQELELESQGQRVRFSISVGVSQLQPTEAGIAPALQRADRALYRAKEEGRARVCGGA